MSIINLPAGQPYLLNKTVYQGASVQLALGKQNDDGTIPSDYGSFSYRCGLSAESGGVMLVEAAQQRDNTLGRVIFTFTENQIFSLLPDSYVFTCIEQGLDSSDVILRGIWKVIAGPR